MNDCTPTRGASDEERDYHSARAKAELQHGLFATSITAARAHFTLATMHLERSRTPGSSEPLLRM